MSVFVSSLVFLNDQGQDNNRQDVGEQWGRTWERSVKTQIQRSNEEDEEGTKLK